MAMITKNNNLAAYALLAPYVREIARDRGHFIAETDLVLRLLERLGYARRCMMLDAACGTGDVVAGLMAAGCRAIRGTDGCETLLTMAASLLKTEAALGCSRWEDIARHFGRQQRFDFAYILGNSLAHSSPSQVRAAMCEMWEVLRPHGTFAFDMRIWTPSLEDGLRQAGRTPGAYRWLGECKVGRRSYWIEDVCSYQRGWQTVTYRIRRRKAKAEGFDNEQTVTLRYSIFDVATSVKWMKQAGFRDVECHEPGGWPYVVVVGRK